MNITLTIPDAQATRIINALSAQWGYQATIDGAPNPETKQQFVKRMLYDVIKNIVRTWEANRDADAARLASIAAVDKDIVLS